MVSGQASPSCPRSGASTRAAHTKDMQPVDDRSEDYRAFVARGYDACGDAYNSDRATNAAAVLDVLIERLPAAAHVLDLGCGAGVPITRALAERCDTVVGADISRQQARRAHAAVPAASIVTADMSAWPFRGEIFDAIVSFYSIFHVPRELQRRVFADIFGSLKPGGYLLASVGRTDAGSYTEPDFFGVDMYWSHFGADAYRQMVVAAGFELLVEQTLPHGYIDSDHEPERHPLIFARKP